VGKENRQNRSVTLGKGLALKTRNADDGCELEEFIFFLSANYIPGVSRFRTLARLKIVNLELFRSRRTRLFN